MLTTPLKKQSKLPCFVFYIYIALYCQLRKTKPLWLVFPNGKLFGCRAARLAAIHYNGIALPFYYRWVTYHHTGIGLGRCFLRNGIAVCILKR